MQTLFNFPTAVNYMDLQNYEFTQKLFKQKNMQILILFYKICILQVCVLEIQYCIKILCQSFNTAPKEINFPRYNMKCSRENVILRGIFYLVSCFPLHFMLYHGNLEYFSDSEGSSFHGLFCVSVSERIEVVCRQEQYSIPIVVLFQF